MNTTSFKRKYQVFENPISTKHNSSKILCKACGNRFSSMRGYNVHISNNRICNLNPLSDLHGKSDIYKQINEEKYCTPGNNGMCPPDDNDNNDIIGIQSNFSRSNDSDDCENTFVEWINAPLLFSINGKIYRTDLILLPLLMIFIQQN